MVTENKEMYLSFNSNHSRLPPLICYLYSRPCSGFAGEADRRFNIEHLYLPVLRGQVWSTDGRRAPPGGRWPIAIAGCRELIIIWLRTQFLLHLVGVKIA
jgi:hypothetical protein